MTQRRARRGRSAETGREERGVITGVVGEVEGGEEWKGSEGGREDSYWVMGGPSPPLPSPNKNTTKPVLFKHQYRQNSTQHKFF